MFSRIPAIVPLFLVPCTCIFLSCLPSREPGEGPPALRAYFLDVGQGDACALRTPGNRWFLYDVGNDARAVIAFLKHAHADTLQAIVLSHPDLDHFGSLSALLRAFPVKKVYLPAGGSADPFWEESIRSLDASGAGADTVFDGDTLIWDGAAAKVLWPAPRAPYSGNDLSTVLRVEYAGKRLLLTGDIEEPAEQAILSGHPDLAADILKVAHHGSRTSSGLAFVSAAHPRWAVISCDSSVYGHPHAEALADLRWVMEDSTRILRTDREGTIAFEVDGDGIRRIDPFGD